MTTTEFPHKPRHRRLSRIPRIAARVTVAALAVVAIGTLTFASKQDADAAVSCGVRQSGAAPQAVAAVAKACGLIGTPYAWGGGHGATPGITWGVCDASNGAPNDCHVKGLDCSGMVRYAYYLAVKSDIISGTARSQYASSRAVARFSRSAGTAPLVPGDLVFYGPSASGIHHVAMYIGGGYMVESPHSGARVRVSAVLGYSDYYGAIRLFKGKGGSQPPLPPPSDPDKAWVDTFADAPVFSSATSTTQTGTLRKGTNYVFCKVAGRTIRGANGTFNHWWLRTDPDIGPADQYVSAYYLSRWGNDVAKDNNGTVIRNCAVSPPAPPPPPAGTKYWVDTFASAPGFASPTSTTRTGTLNAGTNYVFCKVAGRTVRGASGTFNHWWLRTDLDTGKRGQYVSAYYLSRWGNDVAKDNNGTVIRNC
jgi:cell wall-associated NlpC family hydrolase